MRQEPTDHDSNVNKTITRTSRRMCIGIRGDEDEDEDEDEEEDEDEDEDEGEVEDEDEDED